MDSYDSESTRGIFQHFSRSTGFAYLRTAPNSEFLNFQQIFVDFFSRIFQEILEFLSLESEIRNFSD